MINTFKSLLLISLSSISLMVFADEEIEVDVASNDQHEECFYLENETSLSYQYKTSLPLDFNVHFHDDKGMNFLVERVKSTAHESKMEQLTNKQVYCLMWVNNGSKPAILSYQFNTE